MDWNAIRTFIEASVSVFAILNPIGGLPTFVGLTADMAAPQRRRLFRLAGLTSLAIIVVMALAGQVLLEEVFQITLDQFAFAGGLLLVVVGIRNLLEPPQPRHQEPLPEGDWETESIRLAVSPIAIPLLTGPGSIVNVMLIVSAHGRLFALGAVLAAFVFVLLVLNYTHVIYRLMGRIGALAIGRVMQIFIVAIGVKFCFRSLAVAFPALVGP